MKKWIVLGMMLGGAFGALAQMASAPTVSTAEAVFLEKLGFENYTQQISDSLNNQAALTPVTTAVLQYNLESYQVFDLAKSLTLDIYASVKNRLQDPVMQAKITQLTAHLLRPHALLTDVQLPAEVTSLTDKKKFDDTRINYLESVAEQRLFAETTAILQRVCELVNTDPVRGSILQNPSDADLSLANSYKTRIENYLRSKYENLETQNTSYWGRAMAALLVRHARLNQQPELESRLALQIAAQGDSLGNYVSAKQSVRDIRGKIETVTLHSGDFANEYSRGTEAFYITVGVKPGSYANQLMARKNDLMGSLLQLPLYPSPTKEDELVDKLHDNQPMSILEKAQFDRSLSHPGSGYSHVGMVDVRYDAESGVSMPWIWDVYPNGGAGGIRVIGPEGFAFPERFQKVGYTRYSPHKFLAYYKKIYATRSYQEQVWKTYGAKLDPEDGTLQADTSKEFPVLTMVSPDVVQALAATPMNQAQPWFDQQIIPRVLAMMKYYLVSTDAFAFATGFANAKDAAYCSQAMVLAYLQGVDMDPEATQDQWSSFLLLTKKMNIGAADYFDLGSRVISPSGFAWQSKLVETTKSINLDYGDKKYRYYDTNMELLTPTTSLSPEIRKTVLGPPPPDFALNALVNDDDL